MIKSTDTIYIAGHRGLVGSAIVRKLKQSGFNNLIFRTHSELDLIDQTAVTNFFIDNKIDYVVLAAAKVGGIHANNTYPAEFIYDNLMIQCNIINGAWMAGIKNLLFLGSSCIYPREAPQPMKEEVLLTSPLEPTNEPYALAKIAGIKLCESYNRQYETNYRSVMPTNLYGPEDNFHEQNSHVIPALVQRFHQAKVNAEPSIKIWGTGNPKREFLYIDDMADACISVMLLDNISYQKNTQPMLSHINVGTGKDVTIKELAETIKEVTGYQGEIKFDSSKPDGPPRKLLQVDRLKSMGWQAKIGLKEGLNETYQWFLEHIKQIRK
jgi:GDP-L-fucose synthase